MDRISDFLNDVYEPANESAIASVVATATVCGLLAATRGIVAIANKIGEKRLAEKLKNQPKPKTFEEWCTEYGEQVQKAYGLQLPVYEPGSFNDKNALIRSIQKDLNAWLHKLKTSPLIRATIEEHIKEWGEGLAYYFGVPIEKVTVDMCLKTLHVAEGVNGWDTTVEICGEGQDVSLTCGTVCFELADMLKFSYRNYLKYTGAGDGDEGQVCYVIKDNVF